MLQRGEPSGVLVPDLVALGADLGDSGVDVPSGPQLHGVEDQAKRAELILHAVPVINLSATAVPMFPKAGISTARSADRHLQLLRELA